MITNTTPETLKQALAEINTKYGDNVIFNRFDIKGKKVHFTLRTKSSRGPGSRISHSGRHIPAACWHVHGKFFDAVIRIDPKAKIVTNLTGRNVITADGGNWKDSNIGSMMRPLYHSEACECSSH